MQNEAAGVRLRMVASDAESGVMLPNWPSPGALIKETILK